MKPNKKKPQEPKDVKGVKIKGNIALVIEGTTPPTHNTCR
jgi:hypothetical protein